MHQGVVSSTPVFPNAAVSAVAVTDDTAAWAKLAPDILAREFFIEPGLDAKAGIILCDGDSLQRKSDRVVHTSCCASRQARKRNRFQKGPAIRGGGGEL
jgi:hypothetical protein